MMRVRKAFFLRPLPSKYKHGLLFAFYNSDIRTTANQAGQSGRRSAMYLPAIHPLVLAFVMLSFSAAAFAQTVTVTRNVNLRPDPSAEYDPIRLLTPSEPPLTLLDPVPESG